MKTIIVLPCLLAGIWMWVGMIAQAESDFFLPVAGGVILSSPTTALFESPVGLAGGRGSPSMGVVPLGFANSTQFKPVGIGGEVLLGGSNYGLGASVSVIDGYWQSDAGVAVASGEWRLGISGSRPLSGDPKNLSMGVGLTFPVGSQWTSGLEFGTFSQVVASGLAYRGSGWFFATDLATRLSSNGGRGIRLKPGLGGNMGPVQLTLGYGFDVWSGTTGAPFRNGFSGGVGFGSTRGTNFEILFNQISELFAAACFRL